MSTPASFQLVEKDWHRLLEDATKSDRSSLRIISPFIQEKSVRHLLQHGIPEDIRIITRLNANEILLGVNDLEALRYLLSFGAHIRAVRNLHSKLYLFGQRQAVVTSANLTWAALTRNHEFGISIHDTTAVESCSKYFEDLWDRAGTNITTQALDEVRDELVSSWLS